MIDLEKLNPPQREAVLSTQGPLLVLAGAGSGKTRMLTYRIAHLIETGVPAWRILAITFTNKAAREMAERVNSLAGESASDAWVSTFHSCCARILRRDIEKLGYKRSFTIYDDDDQMTVIKRILKENNIDDKLFPPRAIKSRISDAKNALKTPREWLSGVENDFRNKKLYEVMVEYEKRLRESNALDFDDLLFKTLELFAEHPPVLDSYAKRFDYVLVDEFQDTNKAQYELVRAISGEKKNLCVVGDDDQSIYGWRGADLKLILNFEKDFPGTKVIKLEQNYRSTANILEAANCVIANNMSRKEKALWTNAGKGSQIMRYEAMDERDEAAWICQRLELLKKGGVDMGSCAILYRANAQSRVIEEALTRVALPYRVYGGLKFYDRKEVKDIVAYLRAFVNPDDEVSLRRVINEPRRGIGDSTVEALAEYAAQNDIPLFVAITDYEEVGLSSRAKTAVGKFAQLINQLMELRFEQTPTEFVNSIIELTGYKKQYELVKSDENTARLQNIQELIGAISQYQEQSPEGGLEGFLENVALVTDLDSMPEDKLPLTLMTFHSAKGLEFDAVFMSGMEEGVFPITRAMTDPLQMEEERRLCYVGITRAKKQLFMTNARNRMIYGNRTMADASRFIYEIPQNLLMNANRAKRNDTWLEMPSNVKPQPASSPQVVAPQVKKPAINIPGVTKGMPLTPPQQPRRAVLFNVGDRVRHKIFGDGVIREARKSASGDRIVIVFDNGRECTFVADQAPVVKIEL
ncbi:MAG: UvrD-helicase domain-containing protein [Clostridia bacterium]|nr:UvrD-helicase domain-containing protein [Clostridia bacterium]